MNFFLRDIGLEQTISWEQLILEINNTTTYNTYCQSNSYYNVFKQIIISLILEKEIILLDSDFTEYELINLTGYSEFNSFEQIIEIGKKPIVSSKFSLIEKLKTTSEHWKMTLFTSGTTGIPKKVTHDFKSIVRFVKINEQNEGNVWGYAFNPTHMAGVQVFFQILLNGSSIVRLFGLSPKVIFSEIKENRISHLSATPTFYKLLLPCNEQFESVLRLTSGGEKFNENTMFQLKAVFPNAKIANIYASTEAGTLFVSKNDVFSIKPEFEHLILIKNNELLLHNSLMGKTELNLEEWYFTGDLIEVLTEQPLKFKFLSRKNDMINVGGYKVNPIEVEEAILTLSGIKNARVFSKSNSVLGNIICCEIECEDTPINESIIRMYLQSKIQEYKIPRMFKFVSELSTTRTGKLKRN